MLFVILQDVDNVSSLDLPYRHLSLSHNCRSSGWFHEYRIEINEQIDIGVLEEISRTSIILESTISHKRKLRTLAFEKHPTQDSISLISQLDALMFLDFYDCPVTDEDLIALAASYEDRVPPIQTLILEGTNITDIGVQCLSRFSRLKHLNLARTRVTDQGLRKLLSALPNLTEIDLTQTEITDATLEELHKNKNLRVLHLAWTKITDRGVAMVVDLPHLIDLEIYGTKATTFGFHKNPDNPSEVFSNEWLSYFLTRELELNEGSNSECVRQMCLRKSRSTKADNVGNDATYDNPLGASVTGMVESFRRER